jgi:hypothetical protein
MSSAGSHLDLELLAAQLRRHSDDLSHSSGSLLTVLSAALPPELVRVNREGKWKARLAGRKPAVLGIAATIGDQRYELERAGVAAAPVAKIRHESGGVVLSTRTVSLDDWSRVLARELGKVARSNAAAATALRRFAAP